MGDQRWRPFWIGFSLKFSWLQFSKWKNADMNHQHGIVKIAKPCLSIEIMIMKNHQPNGRRVWGTLRAIWCLERGNPWSWGKMYRKPQPIHTNPLYFVGRTMVSGFDFPLIQYWSRLINAKKADHTCDLGSGKPKAAWSLGLRWASYHLLCFVMICCDSLWSIIALCFTVIYYDLLSIIYCNLLWFTVIYFDLSSFTVTYYEFLFFIGSSPDTAAAARIMSLTCAYCGWVAWD